MDASLKSLQSRFAFLEKTPFSDFAIMDVRNLPVNAAELATYGNDEVQNLVTHFRSVLTEDEIENIPKEWPALKSRLKQKRKKKPQQAVADIVVEEPENINFIIVLLLLLIVISPSTSGVERGFSGMNLIKNKCRTRMSNDVLSSLMRINHHKEASMLEWDPEPAMECWLTSAKTKRHVEFQKQQNATLAGQHSMTDAGDPLLPQFPPDFLDSD